MELKQLKKQPGIYMIVNRVSGGRYVGSAANVYERLHAHKWKLTKSNSGQRILQNAWNKYGEEAFEVVVLEYTDDKSKLVELEQKYIDELKPEYNIRAIAKSNYGLKFEGSGEKQRVVRKGVPKSPETVRRMREAWAKRKEEGWTGWSDDVKAKMKAGHADISEATKQKMSDAKKGIAPTKATRAAAKANKDKPRPRAVSDRISETKKRQAQEAGDQAYQRQRERDEKGHFK